MENNRLLQSEKVSLRFVKKSVEWLVNNTEVREFDPIKFEGYQRKIDDKHCERIVEYLQTDFILPTAIICATSENYTENIPLRIVDGQHRVQALKMIKSNDQRRYAEIKDYELSIIVMENAEEKLEIETFITINKTSKKVDTSLAFVLKNKLNRNNASYDLNISRREYIAVELAYKINNDKSNFLWVNKVSFEGPPKSSSQLISLNAFVKSTRVLLNTLEHFNVARLEWNDESDIKNCLNNIEEIFNFIWKNVYYKWQELFCENIDNRRIIQGAIGFTAINRFIIFRLKELGDRGISIDELKKEISGWINMINVNPECWLPGGKFSKFSSESGYNIVMNELLNSHL